MPLKNWFSKSGFTRELESEELRPEELVALGRFDEAKQLLLARLKDHPKDLNAHLKLADVYRHQGQADACRQEYLYVAGAFAEDGFYDKARAVLTKVSRFFPGEIDIEKKTAALERAKRLEYSRSRARAGLLSHGRLEDTTTGRMAVEFEQIWGQLSNTSLVDQLSSLDVTALFESIHVRRLSANTVVVEQGEHKEALFIVVRGNLDARAKDARGHLITLRSFGPGEIVGDTVLFEHRWWPAQYHCDEDTVLLELERRDLEQLIERRHDPKRLFDVLRSQGNDSTVERAVQHLTR